MAEAGGPRVVGDALPVPHGSTGPAKVIDVHRGNEEQGYKSSGKAFEVRSCCREEFGRNQNSVPSLPASQIYHKAPRRTMVGSAYGPLLNNLATIVSAEGMWCVEVKSPAGTLLQYGVPSHMEDLDLRLDVKVEEEDAEVIWRICKGGNYANDGSEFVNFRRVFEEPGGKVLVRLEHKKPRNHVDDKKRGNQVLELESQSHNCGLHVDGSALTINGLEREEAVLQASAEALLVLERGSTDPLKVDGAREEGVVDAAVVVQNPRAPVKEELIETSTVAEMVDDGHVSTPESGLKGAKRRKNPEAVEPAYLAGRIKRCRKCFSEVTKFKYLNNKSLYQPRYQCYRCGHFFTYKGETPQHELTKGTRAEPQLSDGDNSKDLTQQPPMGDVSNVVYGQRKERKRKAKEPAHLGGVQKACRKCSSTNVVFKYLNNGKEEQPRYKCLDCNFYFQFPGKRLHNSNSGDMSYSAISSNDAREPTSFSSASTSHGIKPISMNSASTTSHDIKWPPPKGERKRRATEPAYLVGVPKPCTACGKLNTKFKYLNNKSIYQPRYKCFDCNHFFTFSAKMYHPNYLNLLGSPLEVKNDDTSVVDGVEGKSAQEGDPATLGGEKKGDVGASALAISDPSGLSETEGAHGALSILETLHKMYSSSQSHSCDSEKTQSTQLVGDQGDGEPTVQSLDKTREPVHEPITSCRGVTNNNGEENAREVVMEPPESNKVIFIP